MMTLHKELAVKSLEEQLSSLESERRDVLRQYRREVHTSRGGFQKYFDRINREIARIKSAMGGVK